MLVYAKQNRPVLGCMSSIICYITDLSILYYDTILTVLYDAYTVLFITIFIVLHHAIGILLVVSLEFRINDIIKVRII